MTAGTGMRFRRLPVAAALVVAFSSPAVAQEGRESRDLETSWGLELGAMPGYHDNFFFRGEGAPAPTTSMLTIYGRPEWNLEMPQSRASLYLEGIGVLVQDIEDADYESATVGGDYRLGRFRLSGRYYLRRNQLYFEEGAIGDEPVFFDTNGGRARLRYGLTRRSWIGAEVRLEDWSFDPTSADRDADLTRWAAIGRFPLSDRVGIRLAMLFETKNARSGEYNYDGQGYEMRIEAQPTDRLDFMLRLRRRDREYQDAPPDDSNFERDDTIDDLTLSARWQVATDWGVRFENYYRQGDSTRADRNYDGNRVSLGAYWQF